MATSITVLEHQYLTAITTSEFTEFNGRCDGPDDIRALVHNDVWAWDPADNFGASAGGIASSLVKKDLAITGEGWNGGRRQSNDDVICITEAGAEALIAANAEYGDAWKRHTTEIVGAAPVVEATPEPEAKPARKGTHPKHPKCGCCGKAVYKTDVKGKRVKKTAPWGYCRTVGCTQAGRFVPVVGSDGKTSVLAV